MNVMMKGGKSRRNSRKTRRNSRKSRKNMRGGFQMEATAAVPIRPTDSSEPKGMIMKGGATRAIGTRAEVMHGTAHHTSGGLTRKDLKYNKQGRIVSRRASEAGKKALKRLERAGYKARKGHFKLFTKKRRSD